MKNKRHYSRIDYTKNKSSKFRKKGVPAIMSRHTPFRLLGTAPRLKIIQLR